jgi:hypothetical protein
LLDDLHNLGLTAPAKTPAKNTAILFTQQRIPTHDEIQKSNKIKKFGRKFKGDKDYFKFSFSLLESNKFLIEGTRDTVEWGIILNNPDKVLKVEEKRRIGFEYGHQFILARLSDVSKISLDWSVSFHYMNLDWSSSNIYRDTSESVITYRKDAVSFGFGQKLGVNYTHLFKKKFPVDFYYKYAGAFEDGGQIGKYSNSNFIFEGSGSGEVEYEGTTFFHSFGVNFRYDFYFIGLEYSFGKTNVTYSLPYIETNSHWDGTQYIYNHNIHHDSFYGESRYNSLKLTFGLMFGGGYKWKKLAVKEYKKGL